MCILGSRKGRFRLRTSKGGDAAAVQLYRTRVIQLCNYKERFREANPEGSENPEQFFV